MLKMKFFRHEYIIAIISHSALDIPKSIVENLNEIKSRIVQEEWPISQLNICWLRKFQSNNLIVSILRLDNSNQYGDLLLNSLRAT